MTIDSGWVRNFKELAPQAFTQTCPFDPKVAYINGMPLLMVSEGRLQNWGDFVRSNYARSIIRYFRLGCEAVVIAFDDYDHVPKAKSITQVFEILCCLARISKMRSSALPPSTNCASHLVYLFLGI
jgi:hypothetical protein